MATDISNHDDIIDSRQVIERIDELESELTAAYEAEHMCQDCDGTGYRTDKFAPTSTATHAPTAGDECATCNGKGHATDPTFDAWVTSAALAPIERADTPGHPQQEEAAEYRALQALQEEAEGYCDDWRHGATLIRDSYFKDYAQELADDIGAIDRNAKWPLDCIDWEKAARELQMDYTSVEFSGVTYWVR
jgi:predicted lipid-binding transport protein (Tim44 family)